MEKLNALVKTPLQTRLTLPKELSLGQLKDIINEFHFNETRIDILTESPMDFESDKSIFTFLYTRNTPKDLMMDSLGCPIVSIPFSPDGTASGLAWGCEPRYFCAVPNLSILCLLGFYCPTNTARPALCCSEYPCSPDTKIVEICPADYFCPMASTQALSNFCNTVLWPTHNQNIKLEL